MSFLKALRDLIPHSGRRPKLAAKPLPEPERAYGRPVVKTGIWATLTEEERQFVVSYKGSPNVGDAKSIKA